MPMLYYAAFMHTSHHAGGGILDELVHWFIRGFAWRAGGRIANSIPLGLLIVLVIVIGGIWAYRHYHHPSDE